MPRRFIRRGMNLCTILRTRRKIGSFWPRRWHNRCSPLCRRWKIKFWRPRRRPSNSSNDITRMTFPARPRRTQIPSDTKKVLPFLCLRDLHHLLFLRSSFHHLRPKNQGGIILLFRPLISPNNPLHRFKSHFDLPEKMTWLIDLTTFVKIRLNRHPGWTPSTSQEGLRPSQSILAHRRSDCEENGS